MKYIRQFGIIIGVSFLGEFAKWILPFPIPASIYGLVIMLTGLTTHLIPLESVKDVGMFFVDIMPLMFIPAGVRLLESWGMLKPIFVPVVFIMAVTTVIVMAVSGRVTQTMLRKTKRKERDTDERNAE